MQNAQIQVIMILHLHKVSTGPLLSIHIFCSIQWFYLRTVKALIRLRSLIWASTFRTWPEGLFSLFWGLFNIWHFHFRMEETEDSKRQLIYSSIISQHADHLLTKLYVQFIKRRNCDLTIKLSDMWLYAHTCVVDAFTGNHGQVCIFILY